MVDRTSPMCLIERVTETMTGAAATASERLVPGPLKSVVDRTLVDVACATSGGVGGVAQSLMVDVPAVDAWRSTGVPPEFRSRLTAMTVWRPLRPGRVFGPRLRIAA
jgi:hypothetical protein